jgi:hypothetical protein
MWGGAKEGPGDLNFVGDQHKISDQIQRKKQPAKITLAGYGEL